MLINEFWKIPFLRFILPFITGILLSSTIQVNLVAAISFAALFTGLSFVYRPFINHDLSYHKRWIFGTLISLSLFFIAVYLTTFYNQQNIELKGAEKIIAILNEPPKETEKTIKLYVKTTEYQENNIWSFNKSYILVYLEKDSFAKTLKYGDMLILKGNLHEIKNSGNPSEFDYKQYLNRKQIYLQCYLKGSEWQKIAPDKGNPIFAFAYDLRSSILSVYQSAGIKGDEFAILAALTLGVKDYLSDEIVEAYSDSGAMHVLAVSGLHVGILMAMLNMLFSFLGKKKKLLVLQSILVIFFLWLFALITGLAPSVTRSALMFSFFILGKNSKKKPSSYNSLAAAAFIILLFNPNALYNVGFQLSFLAVLSILFFQQKIYRAIDIKNKCLDYFWQLTTVSIAAQIGTTPISIFYFHQFPIYALLTNIIVIPAAALILHGAVLLLFVSYYAPLAKIIALLLSFVLQILNLSTQSIKSLPISSIENISLNRTELLLIYFGFMLLIIFLITKQNKFGYVVFILLIGSFGSRTYRFFEDSNKEQFIVFNSGKKSSFATISNRKMVFYADSLLSENKKSIEFLTSDIRTNNFVNGFTLKNIDESNSLSLPITFICVDTITATYLNGKTDYFSTAKKLSTNYLIFSKNATLNIENLLSLFNFEKIIIDSSVPEWKQTILKKDCHRKGVPYYNVSEEGAFIWNSNS